MNIFLKVTAMILVAVILGLLLSKQEQNFSLLLTICVCCIALVAAVNLLQPVLDLMRRLEDLVHLESDVLTLLIKATGICLITEIGSMICADAGNTTLGKVLLYLGAVVVLYLSIPLIELLLSLLERTLESL